MVGWLIDGYCVTMTRQSGRELLCCGLAEGFFFCFLGGLGFWFLCLGSVFVLYW